jgi:hypothetical protein
MCSSRLLVGVICAVSLAGCSTWNRNIGQEDPLFGEAVKYDAAAQVIDPEPVYAEGSAQPGSNGDRMAQAVKRYRTDEVNKRHRDEVKASRSGTLSTTNDSGSSGSSPQ